MSRRFTRQGVPSIGSRQPSQRDATLSLTIVRIWMPMISIGSDGSRAVPAVVVRAAVRHDDNGPIGSAWYRLWLAALPSVLASTQAYLLAIDDQRPAAKGPLDSGSMDSGARFRLLVERSPDVFYRIRLTPEPVLEYVSPAAETVTGYSPAEFLDDPTLWQEVVHPDDRAMIPDGESLAAATAEELEAAVVLRWIRRDGSVRWTEHRSAPIFAADGALIGLEGVARDVTARITGEQQLRAANARLRDLLSGIDLGALVLDPTGRVEFINDFLLALVGRRRGEVVGKDWIDVAVPEDERVALREIFAAAIASGAGAGQREDGIVTRAGEERRLLWTSVIQHDADDRVIGLAGIAHDVTDARRIAAEHARLAAAIEQSAESVIITDPTTRILYVNRAFERLSGYASARSSARRHGSWTAASSRSRTTTPWARLSPRAWRGRPMSSTGGRTARTTA